MMSMFQFLCEVKNYSENESEETCLRCEAGFEIPTKIRSDIDEYYRYRLFLINPLNQNGAL